LSGLVGDEACEGIAGILKMIIISHGNISARDLSSELYYSEKQIRRLFHRYVGVGPKTFSRIARVNYALRLLQRQPRRLANIAAQSGFSTSRTLFMIFTQFAGSRPRSICGTCPFFTMTVTKCDV